MAVIEQVLNKKGLTYNSPIDEITVVLDSDLSSVSDINLVLPNNNSKFDESIGFIPSASTVTLLTPTMMYVCIFYSQNGTVDGTNTQWVSGEWKCISMLPYTV